MSTDPPRYSQRHFNWGEPVAADGSIPLDYLMNWLKTNLTNYRKATNKQDVLGPLCQDLNGRGIRCTEANITVEFECLTKTAWRSRTWITDTMYGEDLFESYFDGQNLDLVRRHRDSHTRGWTRPIVSHKKNSTARINSQCLRWLDPSSSGGLSPMAMLVSWFPGNFQKYVKSDRSVQRALLKELCDDLKRAGHADCTENKIAAKLYQIHNEVEQEYCGNHDRSECFKRYGDIFMKSFGYVKSATEADNQNGSRWHHRRRRHRRKHSQNADLSVDDNSMQDTNTPAERTAETNQTQEIADSDDEPLLVKIEPNHATGANENQGENEANQVDGPPATRTDRQPSAKEQTNCVMSVEEQYIRTRAVLGRKSLKDASVLEVEINFLLPKPSHDSSIKYQLGLEQIDVRSQVGLGRKKLQNKGVADFDVDAVLPLPSHNNVPSDGQDAVSVADYPFKLEEIKRLTELGLNRQSLREAGISQDEIDECLPVPKVTPLK
ncbi:hypothetical protein PHMEG_00033994 [Phytophthora megakarya]|uniref:Uncharacterized protein n=1 Tax=Phytophthora megakarya TaxID=4795 RepID=A0A225US22_9STRA|nr:hypothetical protein PHMEG_00033994 [Phytophthora megakarya]